MIGGAVGRSGEPVLLFVQGSDQRSMPLKSPLFSVGRKTEKDLVITDPRVSRDHAVIVTENGEHYIVDQGSKHGTFVNGEKVQQRRKLKTNDRIEFGVRDTIYLVFNPDRPQSSAAREFLSQIYTPSGSATDLEKLTLFVEAARKLNTAGALDEILFTLLDTCLRITKAERGYVFLCAPDNTMKLAAGRNAKGEPLVDDKSLSRSILTEAVRSASEFLLSDTSAQTEFAGRESIVANELRTVICVPLRRMKVGAKPSADGKADTEVQGVLYLDSRFASRDISAVSHDILRAIAQEAASLVENARLVLAEEESRRTQRELEIAATIQQQLMAVRIPEVPFANVRARNISCKEVGGDFFDVVRTQEGLAVIVADVCGKGISAALLASILQGMVYTNLVNGIPLAELVLAVNRFFCAKDLGSKYATALIAQIKPDGDLEIVNCGHVPPLIVSGRNVLSVEGGNLPVGLLPDATYQNAHHKMGRGDRLVLVTDGVTEAENPDADFFGTQRLEQAVIEGTPIDAIFSSLQTFCAGVPLNDDCTVLDLLYTG